MYPILYVIHMVFKFFGIAVMTWSRKCEPLLLLKLQLFHPSSHYVSYRAFLFRSKADY